MFRDDVAFVYDTKRVCVTTLLSDFHQLVPIVWPFMSGRVSRLISLVYLRG